MFNIKFKVLGVPVFYIITHLIPDLSFQCMVRRVLVFFFVCFFNNNSYLLNYDIPKYNTCAIFISIS